MGSLHPLQGYCPQRLNFLLPGPTSRKCQAEDHTFKSWAFGDTCPHHSKVAVAAHGEMEPSVCRSPPLWPDASLPCAGGMRQGRG